VRPECSVLLTCCGEQQSPATTWMAAVLLSTDIWFYVHNDCVNLKSSATLLQTAFRATPPLTARDKETLSASRRRRLGNELSGAWLWKALHASSTDSHVVADTPIIGKAKLYCVKTAGAKRYVDSITDLKIFRVLPPFPYNIFLALNFVAGARCKAVLS
jgi:hypothetical protein